MLDQTLNKTEKELEEESGKELLNPKNVLPIGKKYQLWQKDSDNYGLHQYAQNLVKCNCCYNSNQFCSSNKRGQFDNLTGMFGLSSASS